MPVKSAEAQEGLMSSAVVSSAVVSADESLHWWPESRDLIEVSDCGARLRQITSAPCITHNIYHEQPPSNYDGNRLAMFRTWDSDPRRRGDLLIYDLAEYKTACVVRDVAGMGAGVHAIATSSWSGKIYVVQAVDPTAEPSSPEVCFRTQSRKQYGESRIHGVSARGEVSLETLDRTVTANEIHHAGGPGRGECFAPPREAEAIPKALDCESESALGRLPSIGPDAHDGSPWDFHLVVYDLDTLAKETLFRWNAGLGRGLKTVSPDLRWGLTSIQLGPTLFGIVRIDLETGTAGIIYESDSIPNPHLQFQLEKNALRILVQENRGAIVDGAGNIVRYCDERGIGLFCIDIDGRNRREFPVGPPHTPATTGHECWIGESDRVLVTLTSHFDDGEREGNVVEVRPGSPRPRVVFASPLIWNHISVSRCGRYFVADSYDLPETPLLIGSVKTGNTRVLCDALSSGGGAQYSHAHPYLTGDNKWVIFNSDRTGTPQVYAASVPVGLLESLE